MILAIAGRFVFRQQLNSKTGYSDLDELKDREVEMISNERFN